MSSTLVANLSSFSSCAAFGNFPFWLNIRQFELINWPYTTGYLSFFSADINSLSFFLLLCGNNNVHWEQAPFARSSTQLMFKTRPLAINMFFNLFIISQLLVKLTWQILRFWLLIFGSCYLQWYILHCNFVRAELDQLPLQ